MAPTNPTYRLSGAFDLDMVPGLPVHCNLQMAHASHDTRTCLTRALAEDDNSERSVRFFVNLGLGLVFYGLLVQCCHGAMSLFERS
jgi:hypothetical protein